MSSGQVWETLHLIVVLSHQTFTAASCLGEAEHCWVVSRMEKNSSGTGSSHLLSTYFVPGPVLRLDVDYFTRFPTTL